MSSLRRSVRSLTSSPRRPLLAAAWLSAACSLAALVGCGSRSRLLPAASLCEGDEDCNRSDLCAPEVCDDGICVAGEVVVCEPSSSCVTSACAPKTGVCEETPLTTDEDRDGYRAPLPGFRAGEEGACGTDCDDASALAYPGGEEVCDGVDNDCDGIVDNGSLLLPNADDIAPAVRVAGAEADRSSSTSIAFGAGYFGLSYYSHLPSLDQLRPFFRGLDDTGAEVIPETRINQVNAAQFAASVAWSGAAFGAGWSDNRAGNYEVFFTLFDAEGEKRIPDLRITSADGMSIDPLVFYDQGRFLLLWSDRRDGPGALYLQLVSANGKPIGGNALLVPARGSLSGEAPAIAATTRTYGLANTIGDSDSSTLEFRVFEKEYVSPLGEPTTITSVPDQTLGGVNVVAIQDRFLVIWHQKDRAFQAAPQILGAVVSELGEVLRGPEPITPFTVLARDPNAVSFGDRAVVAWADQVGGKLEIFGEVLDADLNLLESPVKLSDGPRNAAAPRLARSEKGKIGLLYDDFREGPSQAYFLSFGCSSGDVLK